MRFPLLAAAGLSALAAAGAVAQTHGGHAGHAGHDAQAGHAGHAPETAMPAPRGAFAQADLRTADGRPVGRATAVRVGTSIRVNLAVHDLPRGTHGAHVHMVGRCEAPDFASAGGHWNPAARQHGLNSRRGAHAGDMPNLVVGANNRGSLSFTLRGGTPAGLLDTDGAAFVVHADADDQRTDPSGNSGGRIACGVFTRI